ncbi:hypothetical protein SAY86_023733 [Trapa natans]|uniref:RRM domain-containing protein n=1 Tax=Trapa natans TaxID=22666 RepID=A0AAN7M8D8_TRANT|nr:hypothetical protein SAY86_023733 [Trapa natans]
MREQIKEPSNDVENPSNNLYVIGHSHRIIRKDLEKHFSSEGKVVDVHVVLDPWKRESWGFGRTRNYSRKGAQVERKDPYFGKVFGAESRQRTS